MFPIVCLSFCIMPCFVFGSGLCVMFTVNHDAILFPDEFILKYQQHSLVSLAVGLHSCPNFQAPIICFNESLFLSPLPSLPLCLTHIYFFLTFFFFFFLPVQFFDWQVIISLPIFRGKTVIHWRRRVAALWTFSLSPVESCDLPSASRSEKPERDTCSWFLSQHLKAYDSLSFSFSGWRVMVLLRGTVVEFIRLTGSWRHVIVGRRSGLLTVCGGLVYW